MMTSRKSPPSLTASMSTASAIGATLRHCRELASLKILRRNLPEFNSGSLHRIRSAYSERPMRIAVGDSLRTTKLLRPRRAERLLVRSAARGDREPRQENVAGSFVVDHTCIDCDTCRWMQPEVYGRVNGQTAVVRQPTTQEERLRAAQALLACPTHSIHLTDKNKSEIKDAAGSFPVQIAGTENVFHCGYHSEHSYGAASYLLRRPGGNVLIDSPRYDATLAKNIKAMGGAAYMFLSHKDDVADHSKWAEALRLERIIHVKEVTRSQGTTECEIKLDGEGPWSLPDGGGDVEIIFTPGHTAGHVGLMYSSPTNASENTIFTGDHLAFSRDSKLNIMKGYNWYSVERQVESVAKLRDLPFLHVLPGHGRPGRFQDAEERRQHFSEVLSREGYPQELVGAS